MILCLFTFGREIYRCCLQQFGGAMFADPNTPSPPHPLWNGQAGDFLNQETGVVWSVPLWVTHLFNKCVFSLLCKWTSSMDGGSDAARGSFRTMVTGRDCCLKLFTWKDEHVYFDATHLSQGIKQQKVSFFFSTSWATNKQHVVG